MLAALRAPFFDTTFEAAYAFLALLQALTFFAAVFVLRAVFALSPIPALLLSAALAAGEPKTAAFLFGNSFCTGVVVVLQCEAFCYRPFLPAGLCG